MAGEHILVVDDTPEVLIVASQLLEKLFGYRTTTKESGEAAIAAITLGLDVDLVLMDIAMPGMMGPEAAEEIHKRRPELPVVFMSAYVHREALKAGIIPKPFDTEVLDEVIREALDKK